MYAISNIYLIVGQEDAQKVQYRTLECMLFVVAITGALCRRRGRRLRCVVWILPLAFQSGSLLSIVIVLSLPTTSITNLALSFCFDNLRYLSRHSSLADLTPPTLHPSSPCRTKLISSRPSRPSRTATVPRPSPSKSTCRPTSPPTRSGSTPCS